MNGPTLKTVREALGLSVPWFASFCNVQERTVRHWESGRNSVPSAIATGIRSLEKASAELVEQLVDQARLIIQQHGMPPRSEEHTSELQSLMRISYAVFCLKKQKQKK